MTIEQLRKKHPDWEWQVDGVGFLGRRRGRVVEVIPCAGDIPWKVHEGLIRKSVPFDRWSRKEKRKW